MLIYHITKGQLYCTQVRESPTGPSRVNHSKRDVKACLEKHRHGIEELRNGGMMFVTGGTYTSAVSLGEFRSREEFLYALESLVEG